VGGRVWTEEENHFISKNFDKLSYKNIGKRINRTAVSVGHQCNKLGLNKHVYSTITVKKGDKIERLIVQRIYFDQKGKDKKRKFVECLCECGNITNITLSALITKHTKSCGCLNIEKCRERCAKRNFKHGKSHDKDNRLYRIWRGMRSRCNNPNHCYYHRYGLRGIKICKAWDDFLTFENWALNHGYCDDLTIDRIDNDKGYYPENCRWVIWELQCANKPNSLWEQQIRYFTAFQETKSLNEWLNDARCTAKSASVLSYRLLTIENAEEAICQKCRRVKLTNKEIKEVLIKYSSQNYSQAQLAKMYGVSRSQISSIIINNRNSKKPKIRK